MWVIRNDNIRVMRVLHEVAEVILRYFGFGHTDTITETFTARQSRTAGRPKLGECAIWPGHRIGANIRYSIKRPASELRE